MTAEGFPTFAADHQTHAHQEQDAPQSEQQTGSENRPFAKRTEIHLAVESDTE
jgi:hypothetical protein